MPEWWVYIVRCSDRSLYTGIALDVERRFAEHARADGKGAKYLRGRGPLELVLARVVGSRPRALRVEHAHHARRGGDHHATRTIAGDGLDARQLEIRVERLGRPARRRPLTRRTVGATMTLAALPDVIQMLPVLGWWWFGNGSFDAVLQFAIALPGEEQGARDAGAGGAVVAHDPLHRAQRRHCSGVHAVARHRHSVAPACSRATSVDSPGSFSRSYSDFRSPSGRGTRMSLLSLVRIMRCFPRTPG